MVTYATSELKYEMISFLRILNTVIYYSCKGCNGFYDYICMKTIV